MTIQTRHISYMLIAVLIGIIFGSFGSVLMSRLAESTSRDTIKSILIGRSHCPQCKKTLTPLQLIPLYSWIVQKGKCGHCHHKIPSLYLRLEISSGIIAWLTLAWWLYQHIPVDTIIIYSIINRLLLLILRYDIRTQYLHMPLWILAWIPTLIIAILPISSASDILIPFATRTAISYLIWRWAKKYAQHRYGQPEGIGEGDVYILALLSLLTPSIYHIHDIPLTTLNIIQGYFFLMIIASTLTIVVALFTDQKKQGSQIAFLPGIIIARWILSATASSIFAIAGA